MKKGKRKRYGLQRGDSKGHQCGAVPRWNCSSASASHGAGMRATSSRFLSARASRRRSRVGISIRARQRTRRNFVRLIPVPDPMGRSSTRSSTPRQTKAESIRTRGNRLAVLLHERVTLLQQVVLQRVETPKRLFVKALALIGRLVLIKKLLARCCAALQLQNG